MNPFKPAFASVTPTRSLTNMWFSVCLMTLATSDCNRVTAQEALAWQVPVGSVASYEVSEVAEPFPFQPSVFALPKVPLGTEGPERSPLIYQSAPGSAGSYSNMQDGVRIDALGRADYFNDQRIEWSGQEATFGVEGIVGGGISRSEGSFSGGLAAELYLNQPYDRNILVDSPERRSYRGNFEYNTVDISQLYIHARSNDLFFTFGKVVTPFGRTYFPIYSNARFDAPFIRSESILWRETGALFQYDPGIWNFTAAVTNGGPDRDANSSKAFVGRVGVDSSGFALGASAKVQDGIGSEGQKTFNSHVGIDAMYRVGQWYLSSEVIYDEYGLRRPYFDPDDITWGRSIYYRDQNFRNGEAITGVGYYIDLTHAGEKWVLGANVGQFHPKQLGDPLHDPTITRGIFKAVRRLTSLCDLYSQYIAETDVVGAQAGRIRRGSTIHSGLQVSF